VSNTNNGSRTAKVRKIIGNDYYDLKLDFDGLVELQDRTDRGPQFILNRIREVEASATGFQMAGSWNPAWVYEVIRIGLDRAGLPSRDAVKLCDRYIREGFVMDYIDVAADVLFAGLYGPEDEPIEDVPGEMTPEAMSPTPSDGSSGASSMISQVEPA